MESGCKLFVSERAYITPAVLLFAGHWGTRLHQVASRGAFKPLGPECSPPFFAILLPSAHQVSDLTRTLSTATPVDTVCADLGSRRNEA